MEKPTCVKGLSVASWLLHGGAPHWRTAFSHPPFIACLLSAIKVWRNVLGLTSLGCISESTCHRPWTWKWWTETHKQHRWGLDVSASVMDAEAPGTTLWSRKSGNWTLYNGWDGMVLVPARSSAGSLAFSDDSPQKFMLAPGKWVIILVSVTFSSQKAGTLKWNLEVTFSWAARGGADLSFKF